MPDLPTPVTFCEIFPPDDFPLYFYRYPTAPDLQIHADELDLDAIRDAGVFWVTVTGLSQEPSRDATLAALEARGKRGITVLDLDYRPMFWPSREEAAARSRGRCRTSRVAVGNLDECETAVGEREPRARPRRCTTRGSTSPSSSRARRACSRATAREAVEVPPVPVEVVNGLGAGDAFGGALCHGLLAGWDLERIDAVRQRGRRHRRRRGWPAADAMPTADEVEAQLLEATVREGTDARAPRASSTSAPAGRRRSPRRPRARAPAGLAARRARQLMIIAADHPARGALRAGERPLAMADRAELLDRLVLALSRPGVNGVLGTADVLEDLLLLGALDGKVVVGSMNRGGLAGTVFELDDRFTGYDAAAIAADGFEGGKMLLRIDPDDPATAATLEACARRGQRPRRRTA